MEYPADDLALWLVNPALPTVGRCQWRQSRYHNAVINRVSFIPSSPPWLVSVTSALAPAPTSPFAEPTFVLVAGMPGLSGYRRWATDEFRLCPRRATWWRRRVGVGGAKLKRRALALTEQKKGAGVIRRDGHYGLFLEVGRRAVSAGW